MPRSAVEALGFVTKYGTTSFKTAGVQRLRSERVLRTFRSEHIPNVSRNIRGMLIVPGACRSETLLRIQPVLGSAVPGTSA